MGDQQQDSYEEETRWTDDRIRWSDCEDDEEEDDDDSEERAMIDPFKDPDPFEVFSLRFPSDADGGDIQVDIRGYKTDADAVWKSTGLTLWRASEHLCRYMAKNAELLKGKRVLELGAGLGQCGILAHKLGSNICITDGDTDALVHLRENVERNKSEQDGEKSITCRQLLWGLDSAQKFLDRYEHNEPYDVMIASDIVYAISIVEPLWQTVSTMLGRPDGVFLLAFAKRNVPVSIDFVLTSAEKFGFAYERVDKEDIEGIYIYEFRWKNGERI